VAGISRERSSGMTCILGENQFKGTQMRLNSACLTSSFVRLLKQQESTRLNREAIMAALCEREFISGLGL
jgi:hypothetical protein